GQVLTASASDPTSGVASLTYLYCNPSPCTPTTVLGTSTTGPGYAVTWSAEPADGSYDVAVRAMDNAGNVVTSAKQTVVIDSTASFSFTANDSAATFECKLDGGSFAACTSPTSYTGLAEGSHTFTVRSIDSAGNADPSPKVASWSIDTNAPDTTITAHPASVS